jgi:hypothetical protein
MDSAANKIVRLQPKRLQWSKQEIHMRKTLVFATLSLLNAFALAQQNPQIRGQYLETRSADVYVGQCFANGEVNLAGSEAIVAWHVQEGRWDGVSLAGLTVVGAVKAQATLGDPYAKPYPAKSVLIVDKQATPQQRQALINFAQEMGGPLLRNVVRVVDAPVDMEVLEKHGARARLQAGNFVTVETRSIGEKDHLCGNESTFYPPLTQTTHAMPAVAMTDEYRGQDLNTSWTLHDKRSAFVGTFEKQQLLAASR